VPRVGRSAAGGPTLDEQSIEDVLPLRKALVGEGTVFMLKVSGDSMIDAAISDGDWVVVRQQPTADNGDIVAAMLDGEATVKTFQRRDGHVWLMPHNDAYSPIAGDEATVLGQVPAVLRRLCRLRRGRTVGGRRLDRLRLLVLRRSPLLVVLAHALDLGLEDPHRATERAGGVGQALVPEQGDDDDRQYDPVPGRIPHV